MSKEMRIMRAIGDIDDAYIDEAAPRGKSRAIRLNTWTRYAGIAAAAVLVTGIGVFAVTRNNGVGVSDPPQTSAPSAEQSTTETENMPMVIMAAPADTDDEGAAVDWINPFTACATIEEATQTAGFDMSVPESFGVFTDRVITVIGGDLIDVTYYDKDENEGPCIRKSKGSDDISDDYNIYDSVRTADIGGRNVTLSGKGEKIFKAVWTAGGYSFSVTVAYDDETGLTQSEMEGIIKNVK